jgi:hypothetical protein
MVDVPSAMEMRLRQPRPHAILLTSVEAGHAIPPTVAFTVVQTRHQISHDALGLIA